MAHGLLHSPRASTAGPRRGGQQLTKYALVSLVTLLVTRAVSNLSQLPTPGNQRRPDDSTSEWPPPPGQQHFQQRPADEWPASRWQLPEEWRKKLVVAMPVSSGGLRWVRASRAWRRGIRTALVADFQPQAALVEEGKLHRESYIVVNASDYPFGSFGKAAMVPALAAEHFGAASFEWLLYGDDDTLWFMDSVLDIASKMDPRQPHLVTDHFWFWRQGVDPGPLHPSSAAPRCVPCGYDKSRVDAAALGFDPPQACPYCSIEKLCSGDGRKDLYSENCSAFRLRYPPRPGSTPETNGEFLAHGGAGIILSAGLMRMLPTSYMLDCIRQRFNEPGMVHGGDTLFSHCVFFKGVGPTDPGHYTHDTGFSAFDPGGQSVRAIVDLFYDYMKKPSPEAFEENAVLRRNCCGPDCQERLKALTTVHLRGLHFKELEAALAYMRLLLDLRDLYLHLRGVAEREGGHTPVPPSWDNHKVCA